MRPRICTGLILLCLITLLLTGGCRSHSNQRTLLIYTPHGQDLLKDFTERYRKANPDVEIQFLEMGSRQVLERVRAERNRPQADLWWGAAHTTFQLAAEENLLSPYRPSWTDKIPATAHDSQDRWYGTYETPE